MNLINDIKQELKEILLSALGKAVSNNQLSNEPIPNFTIEIPGDVKNGDFATNIAMVSAKAFKLAPRKIAEIIVENIDLASSNFDKVEIAGPGFINLFLKQEWFNLVVKSVHQMGDEYGKTNYGQNKKYMVEFVSANPTGPMHIGNARGGAIGDCLASVLNWAGYDVTKEFYVNDAGNQIEKFAMSLEKRYLQIYKEGIEFPQDAYQGEDIKVLAQKFADIHGDKYVNNSDELKQDIVNFALPINIQALKDDLARYRINYDVWFFESQLHKEKAIEKCIDILKDKGLTYEQDGA
ncbi:MAG: arginine--tRNA ligase, partial [Oscillospiraceae bacterium]